MADDMHEIQLNGKQLVFLFMATAIVAVVIFLTGVMVGRGVRAEKAATVAADTVALTPASAEPPTGVAPAAGGAAAQAADAKPGADDLSYYKKLQSETAPPQSLNPPTEAPPAGQQADVQPAKPAAREAAAAAAPPAEKTAAPAGEPAGTGLVLQVAAFRVRGEAEALAARLGGKGYPAYVQAPAPGDAVQMFRVRLGKYQSRREADTAKRRLEKEEQFKPFLVR